MHRHIDSQHQGAEPIVAGAPDQRIRDIAVLGRIELEPDIVRGDSCRLFHRGIAAA
jgi:hypothetical protein